MKRLSIYFFSIAMALVPLAVMADNWFVGVGGGVDAPGLENTQNNLLANIAVPPAPTDSYATNNWSNSLGLFAADFGYRFTRAEWGYTSLFFEYDDVGNMAASGVDLVQGNASFSSNYSYNIARQAFLVGSKVNFLQQKKFSPFVEVGVGLSENTFSNYNESSSFNLMTYPNQTNDEFAYILGAGVDYTVMKNWMLSLGYRFGYWGDVASGNLSTDGVGATLPAPVHLTNRIYSSEGIAKVSYLFG